MATIVNARDVILQAAPARVAGVMMADNLEVSPDQVTGLGLIIEGTRSLEVSANSLIFAVNTAGTPSPSSVTLTATLKNITGTPTITVLAGSLSSVPTFSGTTATLPYANVTSTQVTLRVSVTDGGDTFTDDISLTKLFETTSGINGLLTNESHTLPGDSLGNVTNYAGASGLFKVYQGTVDVSSSCTFAIASGGNPFSLTTSIHPTTGAYSVTGAYPTGDDVVTVLYEATYGSAVIPKLFTVTKAKAGVDGDDGSAGVNGTRTAVLEMYQWASSAPATFPSGTSTYTWATGQFTAPGTPNGWTIVPGTPAPGDVLYVVRQLYADTGTTATTVVTWAATSSAPAGGAGVDGSDGGDGSDGVNGQRVGLLEVYQWASVAPTSYPSGTSTYTWATGAFTAPSTPNGWSLTPGAAVAGQTLWAISVRVSDNLTTSTSSATWGSSTVYAVGAAGTDGAAGLNTALVYIYQRAASAPTLPSATATYTFSTGGITGLNNGWTATIPSGTNPLYVSVATASNAGSTDTIASGEWASAVVLAQNGVDGGAGTNGTNGTNGVDGLNAATIYLFQRTGSSTPPSLPSATVTYTFATGVATGVNNGWTQTLPTTGGSWRWVTTATAAATTATDTIGSGEWAAASILAQDGSDGADGADGADGIRGSRTFYVALSGATATYSDALATSTASVDGGPVLNDVVTQYNNSESFSETKFWNGTAWLIVNAVVDGNLLVDGTVGAAAIVANSLTAAQIAATSIDVTRIDTRNLTIKDAGGTVIFSAGVPLTASNITPASGWLNSNVTVSGGALSGIGTGNGTVVANSEIAISGGAITGIGTGAGTVVANSAISISSGGALSGAGGGTVTIAGLDSTVVRSANPINSGNVSTYIANATIGTAQVGTLNASVITAGTITTDRLVANAATSLSATANIFASSAPSSGDSSASVSAGGSGVYTFTTTGAPVTIFIPFRVLFECYSSSTIRYVKVKVTVEVVSVSEGTNAVLSAWPYMITAYVEPGNPSNLYWAFGDVGTTAHYSATATPGYPMPAGNYRLTFAADFTFYDTSMSAVTLATGSGGNLVALSGDYLVIENKV